MAHNYMKEIALDKMRKNKRKKPPNENHTFGTSTSSSSSNSRFTPYSNKISECSSSDTDYDDFSSRRRRRREANRRPLHEDDSSNSESPSEDARDETTVNDDNVDNEISISRTLYTDIYDSSCDEIEIEEIAVRHIKTIELRKETNQRILNSLNADRIPTIPTPTSTSSPSTNRPSMARTMINETTLNDIRRELSTFKRKYKARTMNGMLADTTDSYSPADCFGCIWETVSADVIPGAVASFLKEFQSMIGTRDMDHLKTHCRIMHGVFKQIIYPMISPEYRVMWRSWQMFHHITNHVNNAHVFHYRLMTMAKTHLNNSFNSLYGEHSSFRLTGVADTHDSNNYMKASGHLINILKTNPDKFMYNTKSDYNISNKGATIKDRNNALVLVSENLKKLQLSGLQNVGRSNYFITNSSNNTTRHSRQINPLFEDEDCIDA